MGYVAVKGGAKAIEESIKRLKYERLKKRRVVDTKSIEAGMRCLIDQIMSESSLYSETLAAIAIKQAEGSPEEAVFLLRAYRSTLSRNYYSMTADTDNMILERRISASFKDIPGGQILGACYDYTHRLIDFELMDESAEQINKWVDDYEKEEIDKAIKTDLSKFRRVSDYLKEQGLLMIHEDNDSEPDDVTKENLQFPTSRSQRLQMLTRGQTGGVTTFGYAAIRGYGAYHPTVSELRIGNIPICVENPFNNGSDEDSYYIGDIKVTEVETLFPVPCSKVSGQKEIKFEVGYGICYGQNETKAIAMSILDHCLETANPQYPTHDEEFVLLHIDSVEATGFISHLKLPHYVTFQSELDSARKGGKTFQSKQNINEKSGEPDNES
jgi:alpha-D-ribose 1-methylphosphonate 5-triphosphate synthase subunit PhnI